MNANEADMDQKDIPWNPGGPSARKAGCSCPVGENQKGAGLTEAGRIEYDGDDFIVMGLCPLHGCFSGWDSVADTKFLRA